MFDHVQELAEDPGCFVFILIDEVESIASARQASHSAQEPGDAVRVVNAVLTSLDSLKRRPNVLVLCTSNMLESIDPAFCDRLDLQVYMGPPPKVARFEILRSCVLELMDKRVIHDRLRSLFEDSVAVKSAQTTPDPNAQSRTPGESASGNPIGLLWRVAEVTEGMSGRLLRRLPLKAFSHCFSGGQISAVQLGVKLQTPTTNARNNSSINDNQLSTGVLPTVLESARIKIPETPSLSLTIFLIALEQVALNEKVKDTSPVVSSTAQTRPLHVCPALQPAERDPDQGQMQSACEYTPEVRGCVSDPCGGLKPIQRSGSEDASLTGYAAGDEDEDEITVDGCDGEGDDVIASWNMIVN